MKYLKIFEEKDTPLFEEVDDAMPLNPVIIGDNAFVQIKNISKDFYVDVSINRFVSNQQNLPMYRSGQWTQNTDQVVLRFEVGGIFYKDIHRTLDVINITKDDDDYYYLAVYTYDAGGGMTRSSARFFKCDGLGGIKDFFGEIRNLKF